ncbi:MAG TPA: DUF523 domain-containing protein [Myxococcales bacterium]|jgi:uncharacterized protein YbbK (DUF523 family)
MGTARDQLARADVVLCSACLFGFDCRYDARDKRKPHVVEALRGKPVVPVCPEMAGELGVPRPPADLFGGAGGAVLDGEARVVTREGRDVTGAFLAGAALALEAARRYGAAVAVLKEGSPSCGSRRVVVDGASTVGMGVAAAALARAGVALISDEDLEQP